MCHAQLAKLPLVSPEDDTGELPTWVLQAMQPPPPPPKERKVGFCQRIHNAWQEAMRQEKLRQERNSQP